MNILLVEDSGLVREALRSLLLDLPVVDAVDAREDLDHARRALEGGSFEAWIVDFHLPDGTAIDLLDERRSDPRLSPGEVIVFTNHATPAVRERCLQAGADHFFDKSNGLERMISLVESMAATTDCP